MGLRVFALLLGLWLAVGEQVVGTYNQMLDPGRLYGWKTKWATAPIDLSKTNAGSTGVSVSFNFNPSTSLPSGFLEVTFPAAFGLTAIATSGVAVSGQVVQIPATLTAGQDTTLTVGPVSLPATAGPTALFALRTRLTSGGQVIDANLNFGNVYISPQEGKIAGGSVAFTTSQSSTTINKSGNVLTFKFTLGKTLWKHDLIKITTDPYFTLNLGASQCLSVDTTGYINNFNGTSASSPHKLNCVASGKVVGQEQTLWIYGLSVPRIDAGIKDNTFVTIQVPGFTNPDRVYPASAWSIETVRFGTKNTLEALQLSTGPVATAGTVISGSWNPTWGMASSYLVNGLSVYMDLAFTLVNSVPLSGIVTVTTSEKAGSSCTVLTSLGAGTECTATTNPGVFTVTGFDVIPAGTVVTLRHVLIVSSAGAAAASFTVTSVDSSSRAIDQSAALGSFTVSGASSLSRITDFQVQLQLKNGDPANAAGGPGDSSQYIAFGVKTLNPALTAAGVDIYCPITTSMDDFQFSIPTTSSTYYKDSDSDNFSTATGTLGAGVLAAAGTAPTIVAGSMDAAMTPGKISFSPGSDLVGKTAFWLGIYASSGIITLPRVINNAKTAYECRIEIAQTSGTTPLKWIGVHQFSITAQPFTTFTASYFCSNTQVDGNPLRVTFLPKQIDIMTATATRTYYVEVGMPTEFTPRHGLVEGAAYPVDSNLSTGVMMTVGSRAPPTGSSFGHQVSGMGLISASLSSPIYLYFPVSAVTVTSLTFSLQSYYTLAADKQALKYITHYSTTAITLAAGSATSQSQLLNIVNNGPINGSSMSTPLRLTTSIGTALTGDTYFYLVFPKGYVFNNLRDVQSSQPSSGSGFSEKKYFSSPSSSFPFPGILVKVTTSTARIDTTSTEIAVFGLVVPLGKDTGSQLTLVHSNVGGDLGSTCYMKVTQNLTTSAGTISQWTVSPSTIKARGPGGVDITHTITVVLPHGIDIGGKLVFAVDPAWEAGPGFYCHVTGINNAVCAMTTNSVLISGFDDFSKQTNVAVSIYLVHLLAPSLGTNLATNFQLVTVGFTTTTSTALGSRTIDVSASVNSNGIVLVQPYISPGVATFEAIKAIPPNAGTLSNDLYVRFYMQYDLPALSEVSVTSGYTTITGSDLRGKCWLAPLAYSSCTVSGSEFKLVLSQSYTALSRLELFIRSAVNAPAEVSTTATTTVYAFKIKASWGGAMLIDFPDTLSPDQILTPTPKVSTLIAAGAVPISFSPTNAGESATYIFSFSLSISPAPADSIWLLWPEDFDPYVGQAIETLSEEPGNFYLPCSSAQLGPSLSCRIDHWTLVINGFVASAAPLAVTLQVEQVINPAAAVATGAFRMQHFDGNNTLVEYLNALGTVKPTALPAGLIDVRSVSVSSQNLRGRGDYTFDLYVADTFTTSSRLQVLFPPQFSLSLQDKKDSYSCNSTFVDETATSRIAQVWNSDSSCTASLNTISLTAPSTSKDFTKGQLISLTVSEVATPEYGLPRVAMNPTWDFDVQDREVYTVNSWWVDKFTLFVYNGASSAMQYTSKSYAGLNSAYLGFMQPLRSLSVNNYNPADGKNRVVVWPGTQTDLLPISTVNSTFPMSARMLVFTYTINSKTPDGGRLKLSSVKDSFVMLFSEQTIYFRVAADIATPRGLYYVSWQVTETSQNGTFTNQFIAPPMTLIEVPSLVPRKYSFTVSNVPAIPVGGSSLPIKVSISNPPHTEVSVNIAFLLTPTAQATPPSLLFSSDITEQYFSIELDASHDAKLFPSFQVLFNLTGIDAPAYAIQPGLYVGVRTQQDLSQGAIIKLGISSITRTSVALAPVTDRLGVIYYLIAPKGTALLSFEQVKELAPTFDYISNVTTDISRNQAETTPALDETWPQYQVRKYLQHVTSFELAGGLAMATTSTTAPVVITGLAAGTDYQVLAYLDVQNELVQPGSRIEYFTTSPIPPSSVFSLTFQLSVAAIQMPTVAAILAPLMSANPSQISDGHMNQTLARRLDNTTTPSPLTVTSTTFTFTLLPDRFAEQPIPSTQTALSQQALTDLRDSLVAKGITNTLTAYVQEVSPTPTIPVWKRSAEILAYTNVSATVIFQADRPGKGCCVALEGASPALLAEQIELGYSFNWTKAVQACTVTNSSQSNNQVTLSALQPDTNYYISCVATDSLPIWPTLMEYSEAFPAPFIPLHTPLNMEFDEITTDASSLVLGAILILL